VEVYCGQGNQLTNLQ